MSLLKDHEYVKTEGDKIYLRASCFDRWTNPHTADAALELAAQLVSAANRVNGSKLNASGNVTLTISRSEAEALAAVLNRVGGDPAKSPRGKTDGVAAALKSAGVHTPTSMKFDTVAGGLWFRDYDGKPVAADVCEAAETVYTMAVMLGMAD